LVQGEGRTIGAYTVTFVSGVVVPALSVLDLPGAVGDRAVIQMPVDAEGEHYFVVSGISAEPVFLRNGQPMITPAGYRFEFLGQVEAAGIEVKRDPGDTFIWVGVIMALAGLAMTFYVPRRRLWVKVTPERTYMAGIAERTTRFSRELRLMGAQLGAPDALQPADTDRHDDW
jgi:cytochrome c biogenesis protein ResB